MASSAQRAQPAPHSPPLEVRAQLDGERLRQVLAIVTRATEADGTTPLDEHVLLHLRHGGEERARHVLFEDPPGTVAGYAHLDVTDEVAGASAQLVVDPARRGQGHAGCLVRRLLELTPDGRLRLWAHGGHPAAAALARSMGFRRHRSLWQMRRSLYAALPALELPAGVSVRTFRPGADDAAWVEVNAAAFADHPEQGALTLDDLHRRMAESWFDPAGFFLAERLPEPAEDRPQGPRLVGFHWTKVHGGSGPGGPAPRAHGHEAIGEVYVVGVHPDEQGTGLGRALTLVGLAHLRGIGLPSVMLYVDESNTAAIRLYSSLGFTRWDVDVQYAYSP